MATRKLKNVSVAHIIFLLDSANLEHRFFSKLALFSTRVISQKCVYIYVN